MTSNDVKRGLCRFLATRPWIWAARVGYRLITPRLHAGAVGAVFDERGRVLLLEHVLRTDFPWGLPGGWIERGEDPQEAVRREIHEELGLDVDVRELLLSGTVGRVRTSVHPPHLGLAFYCRLRSGVPRLSPEIVSAEWVDPANVSRDVAPFQGRAIELGRLAFLQDAHRAAS